jgi:hypothetical protein
MLDNQTVTGKQAKGMFDLVNQTRLQNLQTWSNGGSAPASIEEFKSGRGGGIHEPLFLRRLVSKSHP